MKHEEIPSIRAEMNKLDQKEKDKENKRAALAKDIAAVQEQIGRWAKQLEEARAKPDLVAELASPHNPNFEQAMLAQELQRFIENGVTPQELVDYGKAIAKELQDSFDYEQSLDGTSKTQLVREFFRQSFASRNMGSRAKILYKGDYPDKLRGLRAGEVFAGSPYNSKQSLDYHKAELLHESAINKRSVVLSKLLGRE